MRHLGRSFQDLRKITFTSPASKHAEGSCLACFGDTHVLCTATVEEKVPPFLKNTGSGWITAEYGMLPRATGTRTDREAARGKQTGRTQEIQRIIGRSLRAVIDLKALGERQIKVDCDVLQADGGTRTTAISGAYVAVHMALNKVMQQRKLAVFPLKSQVAAVSCGLIKGNCMVDLDFEEDSSAEADINIVLASTGHIVEIQGTAEKRTFLPEEFLELLTLAQQNIQHIFDLQQQALKEILPN